MEACVAMIAPSILVTWGNGVRMAPEADAGLLDGTLDSLPVGAEGFPAKGRVDPGESSRGWPR